MSCLVVANPLESGDDLNLDQTAGRKGGTESAARGERSLELGGVDLVHGSEVGNVGQIDRGLNDIGKGGAGSGQQGLDVSKGLLSTGLDALGHLAGCGVDAQLAGQEHHVAGLDAGEYGPMAAGALSEDTTVLLMFFSLRSDRERERGVHTGRHNSV